MNRLVLAFGIVCLLQGLSAAPRPEYGLAVSIKNSDKISDVGDDVSDILSDISGFVLVTLEAEYDKYEKTLEVITGLKEDILEIVQPILDKYTELVEDESGNVADAFAPFLSAIDDAKDYIEGTDVTIYLSTLGDIGYDGIVDQINDEGNRLLAGLTTLKSAAVTVQNKISAAYTGANNNANVPMNILNANLKLADMYAFLTAAKNLKAFLPLFTYILATVNQHLGEGDSYITSLQNTLDSNVGTATSDYEAELDEVIADIKETVTNGFGDINSAYGDIYDNISTLDLSEAADLDTTVNLFLTAFNTDTIGPLDQSLATAFAAIGNGLNDLIVELTQSVSAVDDELVQLLVDTLIGNLEYGEYCYYKYKDLVENLLSEGLDGGWECVDKEYLRLLHLQDTLRLILELLAFDYEYMDAELAVCDSVAEDSANADDCVTELNTYYTTLYTATTGKRDLIYDLAEGEANASKNRLLICFELVFIDTSVTQTAAITTGLTECAAKGPNGTD